MQLIPTAKRDDKMQTADVNQKYKEGIFVRELKNRFLCEVLIDGTPTVCYVPSSCHLGNFLSLAGKRVLLLPTEARNARTAYALFAVPYKRSYIMLNTSVANIAVFKSIQGRKFHFLGNRRTVFREHIVEGYKTDLFIEETKTIIEIKSVIAIGKSASFPTVYSARTQGQLIALRSLLARDYRVAFFVVSLNPYVTDIHIDLASSFFQEYQRNTSSGMIGKAFSCRLGDTGPMIDREISLLS